jgi:RNA polymerase sigma factor (sigma-70 family)
MATRTEQELHRRNAHLLEDILRESGAVLRRQALNHTRPIDLADDVLQRAYELFIERFRPPYHPLAWLMTTIKREAWAQARHPSRTREIPTCTRRPGGDDGHDFGECTPDPGAGPPERALERENVDNIRSHFRGLKPDERTALSLLAFGYSYAEIGEIKGWTRTKVNRCIAEGRAALRDRIANVRR